MGDYTAPAARGISDCRDPEGRTDRGGVLALVLWQREESESELRRGAAKAVLPRLMVKTPFLVLQNVYIFRATQQDFLQRTYYNDLLMHNHPVTQTGSKGIVCDQESSNQRTHMETCLSFRLPERMGRKNRAVPELGRPWCRRQHSGVAKDTTCETPEPGGSCCCCCCCC